MSAALVRRGLELLSADMPDGPDRKKQQKKKKKKEHKVMKGARSKKRSSRGLPVVHKRVSAKDRRMRNALEEDSRGQKKDHAAENLQYFLHSSSSTAPGDHTTKIVRQNSGRQSRSSAAPPVKRPQESHSVFTEEEFQQFQREYFGRTVEEQ